MRVVSLILLLLTWSLAFAETFDIFEYTLPQGWKKNPLQGGVMLSLESKTAFGSIILYGSVPAGNNPEQNFKGEWKRLVEEGLGVKGEPSTDTGPANGEYQNLAGGIAAEQDGVNYVVLLSTFSGNGRVGSVMYIATDEKLFDLFDTFNTGLKLNKPKAAQAPPANSPPKVNAPVSTRTIATPTTNFNNGWTATVQNGFVRLAKEEVLVLLHYAMPLPENMWVTGNEKERVQYYWNKLVANQYRTEQIKVFENGVCYFCLYFGEASASEISTGASKHVAIYVYFDKGQGYVIQAVAPNFQTFQKYFPNIETLGKMSGYNKFAVKLADLPGKWKESDFVAGQYYNSVTGAYAGMNAVSSYDEFNFSADGSYLSKHSGASGFVGSQKFFSLDYKGKLTITDWKISMSNRFDGKTEEYEAFFQITLAGPVLNLIRVGSSGLRYSLMKE